ncbi:MULTISPECIES: metallothionein [unclassified Pseudomonas]|uniref:metallothionein n=1 Tax=unclassified Pseudomonas TaxID=196821 RepID=UPI000BD0D06C|nr:MULTISPECIES: metallothionein [unclassified Pseudomonas]PVZ19570.1 metallothionein [Pseudomonas sp. URIL14HWK12:I12]PVZ22845.1 metallothionein [Pseudomonas sp. URIL14HWK12:I10]PVZ37525.1 metallothionein [Pseudomonas sp. URIL14HWK12:I11]SNZ15004.1 metallothionein [Pseudomonas sp. URIL14HWK12:I9]
MTSRLCACDACTCELPDPPRHVNDGLAYCCPACADGHRQGEKCQMPGCQCSSAAAREQSGATLDHAVEETFPASDPVSP